MFYTLSLRPEIPLGASGWFGDIVEYFSTEKQMDVFKKKNPAWEKATFGTGEISLKCAKDLIRLSKKRPKCFECGR